MEYQKFTNLLGTTIDEIPRFITEKWVEMYNQSGSGVIDINQVNK